MIFWVLVKTWLKICFPILMVKILTGVLGFAGEIFDDLFSSFGSSSGGF